MNYQLNCPNYNSTNIILTDKDEFPFHCNDCGIIFDDDGVEE